MGRGKGKITFSQDIDEPLRKEFDAFCTTLEGHKGKILEAALRVYMILPAKYQLLLLSPKQEITEVVYKILKNLPDKEEKARVVKRSIKPLPIQPEELAVLFSDDEVRNFMRVLRDHRPQLLYAETSESAPDQTGDQKEKPPVAAKDRDVFLRKREYAAAHQQGTRRSRMPKGR